VDQDGDVIDILHQPRRDRRAAARFFHKLLKGQGRAPRWLITDKLRSFGGPWPRDARCCSHHAAVPEQSSRSLSSTDSPTRATDAQVQIHRSRATIVMVHGVGA
jgi:putative transposase